MAQQRQKKKRQGEVGGREKIGQTNSEEMDRS